MKKDNAKDSKKIEQLGQQIDQLTEALQRERADATNVRRRADDERAKMGGFYKSMVISEFLPVIDNFERALKHIPTDSLDQEYIKGIQGVVSQFEQTLSKLGVERIQTVGTVFDPNIHEAVSHEEGEGGDEIVSEELQAGFRMGDDVIRHAMVRVRS